MFSHTAPSKQGDETPNPASEIRLVRPHKGLPGSRAIVGGFLVAVAAIGTFALATNATRSDVRPVVVAAHDIAPDTRLQASDLKVIRLDASSHLDGVAITNPQSVVGRTVLGPVKTGELIQQGSLAGKANESTLPQVSFSLPASRALGGDIRPGETVDIVATSKSATDSRGTSAAVRAARVIRVDQQNGTLGKSSDLTIVVAVETSSEAEAVISAVDTGQVTLIRTTGLNS